MKYIRNNKGFSYVEMLVVIGIMAVMTGFLAITIGTANRNNVRRAKESIEAKFNEARISAMSKGTEKGYLIIARYKGSIYTYVGEMVNPDTVAFYTAEDISKRGTKLCSSQLVIQVGDIEMNSAVGDLVYVKFKQSTGGVAAYSGSDPTPELPPQFTISVANQKNTMVSSFKVYKSTGKIKTE